MFIKEPIQKINKENPFQEDKLDREESSEILTQLLRSVSKPFVLSITSGWGTGKTTFVRMWKQHLINEGFPCIYFNAWENQYGQDPLISFIGEINSQISSNLGETSQAKTAFENAKQLSGKLAKRAIPAAIKLATYGILDLNELTENTIAEMMTDIAEDNIKNYEESKQTVQKFKKSLSEFVSKLSSYKKYKGLPLTFIIDELDRCRPLYVIDLLERINHIFNIQGIVFVLVMDKDQISHSIKSLYGDDMDVNGYLKRFVNLNYKLPEPEPAQYCIYLFETSGLLNIYNNKMLGEEIFRLFSKMAEIFAFDLRTQEQCVSYISLASTSKKVGDHPFIFLVFLIAIKAVNEPLYYQYVKRQIGNGELIRFITEKPNGKDFLTEFSFIEGLLISAYSDYDTIENILIDKKNIVSDQESVNRDRELIERAGRIVAFLEKQIYQRGTYNYLEIISRKIELLERFVVDENH